MGYYRGYRQYPKGLTLEEMQVVARRLRRQELALEGLEQTQPNGDSPPRRWWSTVPGLSRGVQEEMSRQSGYELEPAGGFPGKGEREGGGEDGDAPGTAGRAAPSSRVLCLGSLPRCEALLEEASESYGTAYGMTEEGREEGRRRRRGLRSLTWRSSMGAVAPSVGTAFLPLPRDPVP